MSSDLINIATPSAKELTDTFLADDEGVIFSKDFKANLPTVFIYKGNVQTGDELAVLIINILKVLDNLKKINLEILTVKLVEDEFLVIDTNPKIILKLTKDIDIQLASLQLILQQAKIDERSIEFIDLRFDKPVLKFAPKKNG